MRTVSERIWCDMVYNKMNVLAVDDEKIVLKYLMIELNKVFPNDTIIGISNESEWNSFADSLQNTHSELSYAFLDIQLWGITGLDLAKSIKEKFPKAKIIFCTAFTEYAYQAYQLYAVGYLLKPVTEGAIVKALNAMDEEWKQEVTTLTRDIKIQTFGNFEVFVDGIALSFEREKSKELLAYLVDRKGAAVTTAEIAGVLWEDKPYNRSLTNQVHTVLSALKKSLKQQGISSILIKTWNHLAIDTSKFKCDAYDFWEGNSLAVNSYRGEYMANYSWAESTNGEFHGRAEKNQKIKDKSNHENKKTM